MVAFSVGRFLGFCGYIWFWCCELDPGPAFIMYLPQSLGCEDGKGPPVREVGWRDFFVETSCYDVGWLWSFVSFVGCLGLNSGLCTCVASIPSLERHKAASTCPHARALQGPKGGFLRINEFLELHYST